MISGSSHISLCSNHMQFVASLSNLGASAQASIPIVLIILTSMGRLHQEDRNTEFKSLGRSSSARNMIFLLHEYCSPVLSPSDFLMHSKVSEVSLWACALYSLSISLYGHKVFIQQAKLTLNFLIYVVTNVDLFGSAWPISTWMPSSILLEVFESLKTINPSAPNNPNYLITLLSPYNPKNQINLAILAPS